MLGILDRFPLLTNLNCAMYLFQSAMTPRTPKVYPQLQSLSLRSYRSVAALGLFTLPNLRRLELHADLDLDILTSFLSRSRCLLDRLIIGGEDLRQQAQIIECLNHFPSVETLQIKHSLRLIQCLRNPSLLPGLQDPTIAAQNAVVG
ncbi:hypothetical protein DFH09DRAFT_1099958 [Mycena vulgaris]|nr:hypothetical protein DFH09DRAFT_1099958 [Mycena vulgaris]